MTRTAALLRVINIRSQNPKGFGGCIFTGKEISEDGSVLDAKAYWVAKVNTEALAGTTISKGQWVRIEGISAIRTNEVNGFQYTEQQIDADEFEIRKPSGEHLITFIAENERVKGVGYVKARKLWDALGEQLLECLEYEKRDQLQTVLSETQTEALLREWAGIGNAKTIKWLQQNDIEPRLSRKLLTQFGADLVAQLTENPYILTAYSVSWDIADKLALNLGIGEYSKVRLEAAISEVCYREFTQGNTVQEKASIIVKVQRLTKAATTKDRQTLRNAIEMLFEEESQTFVNVGDDSIAPFGAWIMETAVSKAIVEKLNNTTLPAQLEPEKYSALLLAYQNASGITLNDEQREAINAVQTNNLLIITGGAGVGKTTVLRAIHQVLTCAERGIFQVALTGKAAKRMQESTGMPAHTLASFLKRQEIEDQLFPITVVVDEASMVDLISFYQLCMLLPSSAQIILIGDPAQLMPVGPGLILHTLAKQAQVPQVELVTVKRHQGAIYELAAAARGGIWPAQDLFEAQSISIHEYPQQETASAIVELFLEDPNNTQIICAKKDGPGGVKLINRLCQEALTSSADELSIWNEDYSSNTGTGLRVGDRVICGKNLWDHGLQNGSMGVVHYMIDAPEPSTLDEGDSLAIGQVTWDDGVIRNITVEILQHLELGYAITVHKSQGSQWKRVIASLEGSRILDRSLIYTAFTRAEKELCIVGAEWKLRAAVLAKPRADERKVGLGEILDNCTRHGE
jgi:exodeoxyribonuclease V alpha subunit